MFHEILLTLLGYHSEDLLSRDDTHHTFTLNPSSSAFHLFHDSESQQLSHLLSLGWYSHYLSQYIQRYSLQWHGNHPNLQKYSAYHSALCLGIHEIHEVPSPSFPSLPHPSPPLTQPLGISFKSSGNRENISSRWTSPGELFHTTSPTGLLTFTRHALTLSLSLHSHSSI